MTLDERWQLALQRRRERLAANQCGDCGVAVTGVRQEGRCVYLEPCGHRHGSGDAARVAKAFGL